MIDFVIPKNNETEFIEISLKLGVKKIFFLYDFDKYNDDQAKKILNLANNPKNPEIEIGFIANGKNLNNALKQSKLIVVKSCDKDRDFIESKKIKLIYGFEEIPKKDFLHQRASGLNHTICELAKKNKVAIGFSYSSLLSKNNNSPSLLAGRMMQNIGLCQKYKVKTIIGCFSERPFDMRSSYDVIILFMTLGMDGKIAKESLTNRDFYG